MVHDQCIALCAPHPESNHPLSPCIWPPLPSSTPTLGNHHTVFSSGVAESWVTLILVFRGASILFSVVAVPVYIPTSGEWGSLSPQHLITKIALTSQTPSKVPGTPAGPHTEHRCIGCECEEETGRIANLCIVLTDNVCYCARYCSQWFTYPNLMTTLWGRCYYFPQFADDTKPQRGWIPQSGASMWFQIVWPRVWTLSCAAVLLPSWELS